MNANAPAVDLLEFRTSANMLSGAESQTLLAADGKALATLRASAFQDQTAVFRGHSDQKPVSALTMPSVGLKCANALGHGSL